MLMELIRNRCDEFGIAYPLKTPTMENILTSKNRPFWFPIDGMYGGFRFWIENDNDEEILICESWSRVCAGSGQKHIIRISGCELVDSGFV
jgi:hypothetical protein